MRIEFMGSGGAIPMPRPGCFCAICVQARLQGVPYARTGPSVFVHGPDVLIDTPEESRFQLNRAGIRHVPHALYSHWHPDHVMGRRVFEMNQDWRSWPPHARTTDVYLPQQVAEDFKRWLGSWEHLTFFEKQGLVRLNVIPDGDTITLNGVQVRPFRLSEDYVYAFLFEEDDKRVLIAPDELYGWQPPDELHGIDLAVVPMGITEFNPFSGERHIPQDHPVLHSEATLRQTLDMLRHIQPKRAVLTHIEEPDQLGHDDLQRLAAKLQAEGLPVRFAYDTLQVKV